MTNCPICQDDLDDGYCHTCQHDLFDEPEWFMAKISTVEIQRLVSDQVRMQKEVACLCKDIERLEARVEDLVDAISSGSHKQMMAALYKEDKDAN